MATLAVVENALRLRAELRQLAITSGQRDKAEKLAKLPIWHHEHDYFEKVVADVGFIASCELAKLFKFSKHFDPFFLSPSQPSLPIAGQTIVGAGTHSMITRYLVAINQ